MPASSMQLKILMPFGVFAEVSAVTHIVAETRQGSLGILPHRLDCVAALAPGILTYVTDDTTNIYVAVDEGVLVKAGNEVVISVRHAVGGTDLGQLRHAIEKEFLTLDDREKTIRRSVAELETDLVRRMAELHHV